MVLDHVPERAGTFVVGRASLDAELLGDRDLDVVDVVVAPDRLEDAVGKAQDQDVLHGLFGEVVVDPVDALFAEGAGHQLVQLPGGLQVGAERLLDQDPALPVVRASRQPDGVEVPDDGREDSRWRGAVVEPVPRLTLFVELLEAAAQADVAGLVPQVERLVEHRLEEAAQHSLVDRLAPRPVPYRVFRQCPEVVRAQLFLGGAEHGEAFGQHVVVGQVVQGWQQLPPGEVSGGSEDDQENGLHRPEVNRCRSGRRRGICSHGGLIVGCPRVRAHSMRGHLVRAGRRSSGGRNSARSVHSNRCDLLSVVLLRQMA